MAAMPSVRPSRFLFQAVTAAVLCCCAAALAPAAGARTPLRAKFKVTLSGVDQANWSYRYPATAPRRLCVPHERIGSGTQTVRYASQSAFVVKAKSSRNGMPKLAPGALNGARFPVQATITRQSSDTGTGC
jgi:hypothetical protein